MNALTAPPLALDHLLAGSDRYSVVATRDPGPVDAALRLRHQVFVREQGLRFVGSTAGGQDRDMDAFDQHCDHVVVREDATGEVVGTYRMLTPDGADDAGGLFSDTLFDLSSLAGVRPDAVEVGRACVHPDHRSGAVLSLVWAGMWRYLIRSGRRWILGNGDVPLGPDGTMSAGAWNAVQGRHLSPATRRVTPHLPATVGEGAGRPSPSDLPALLRGYLSLGAEIGGRPAVTPGVDAPTAAILFVLLDRTAIDPRWRRRLLGSDG